ncbi:12033_t:CDS:2, partial [Acaulospora colombiana]
YLTTCLDSMGARRESPARRALAHVWKDGRAPRDWIGRILPNWGPFLLIVNPTCELQTDTGRSYDDYAEEANFWIINNPGWKAKPVAAGGVKRKASSEKGESEDRETKKGRLDIDDGECFYQTLSA